MRELASSAITASNRAPSFPWRVSNDGPYFADPAFAIVPAVFVVGAQDRTDGVCRARSCGLRLQPADGHLWYIWYRDASSSQQRGVRRSTAHWFRRHGGAREAFGDLGQGHHEREGVRRQR